MPMDDLGPADRWLAKLVENHRSEIERRGLGIHLDIDSGFALARDARLDRAFRELIAFAIATVPDDCEIYLAANRDPTPVTRVGAGRVTLRWQVAGPARPGVGGPGGSVVRIHPIALDAEALVDGAAAKRIRAAFDAAGCLFRLEATSSGRELIARADRS
jgi:hypothetical protein